ncbi:MAG: hypothetical protein ACMXYB_00065 [Candidatus Woesearchaeota archaeon]
MKQYVDIETPYSGKSQKEIERNILFARACIRDSILRGEIPFASHLLYTQSGILDDTINEERELGINLGKELIEHLPNVKTVVYENLGITQGMKLGIELSKQKGRDIEYRKLQDNWEEEAIKLSKKHSQFSIWGVK